MMHRSWLFVPADSARKLAKIPSSGADAVILDLEDAVAPERKLAARELAVECLTDTQDDGPGIWVRVNPASSELFENDLTEIVPSGPAGIVLPKPDSFEDVLRLEQRLGALENEHGLAAGAIKVMPIVTETAAALAQLIGNLPAYAKLPERVVALTWGAEDLAAELAAVSNKGDDGELTFTYQLARSLCHVAAATAGVGAVEGVHADFRDEPGLRRIARRARRDGFTGMLAIHPAQVEPVNAAFTPSADEVATAERIVAVFAAQPGAGVVGLDGKMLDRPHLLQAERVLALARQLAS